MLDAERKVVGLRDRLCFARANAQIVFNDGLVGVAVREPRRERQIERIATD